MAFFWIPFLTTTVAKKATTFPVIKKIHVKITWFRLLQQWLESLDIPHFWVTFLSFAIVFLVAFLISFLVYFVSQSLILGVLSRWELKSKEEWKTLFNENKVSRRLFWAFWIVTTFLFVPSVLQKWVTLLHLVQTLLLFIALILFTLLTEALLDISYAVYTSTKYAKKIPIKGVLQLCKVMVVFLAIVTGFAILLDKSPIYFLSGLGALTAVIMLIFKDTLLGLAAGLQVAFTQSASVGDWILLPKQAIEGKIVDIALTTTNVRKSDGTLFSFPTYFLTSEIVHNFRPKKHREGRIILRRLNFDFPSIKKWDETWVEKVKEKNYWPALEKQIEGLSEGLRLKNNLLVSYELTNLDVFLMFVKHTLQNHPHLAGEDEVIVRKELPSKTQFPVEFVLFVYAKYSRQVDTTWEVLLGIILTEMKTFELNLG